MPGKYMAVDHENNLLLNPYLLRIHDLHAFLDSRQYLTASNVWQKCKKIIFNLPNNSSFHFLLPGCLNNFGFYLSEKI
jgi:hypothetical protein